jgi:hypothetical protein
MGKMGLFLFSPIHSDPRVELSRRTGQLNAPHLCNISALLGTKAFPFPKTWFKLMLNFELNGPLGISV